MKKLCAALLSSAMLLAPAVSISPAPTAVLADTFNNSAFMGTWTSSKATDSNYSQLYINYCDDTTINVTLKQIYEGKEPFVYEVYAGTIKENESKMLFDYTDEYGTKGSGFIELAFFLDNIWLSAYTDDGRTLLQGMYKNGEEHFNPYASPYSYNVSVSLNGAGQALPQKPFILHGTTYVPLRGLFGSMNLNVYWDDYTVAQARTQMITASKNSTIMQFSRTDSGKGFGSWKLLKWESEYPDTSGSPANTFDIREIQPIIIDGATYVPLRIVTEGFGAQVNWNDVSKTVEITASTACDTKKTAQDEAAAQSYTIKQADSFAKQYAGMTCADFTPYYTYKSKYFKFSQAGTEYKLHYDGSLESISK